MSTLFRAGRSYDVERLSISWGWMLALGVLMTVMGLVGVGMAFWLTLVVLFWLGVFALISGLIQIADSLFHHKGWKSRLWHAIIGVLYIGAGLIMILTPLSAAFWLTVMLASSMIAIGVARLVMAFQVRGQGLTWLGLLLSAIVSILLGGLIFYAVVPSADMSLATAEGQLQWLLSWGWIIGLFVAAELIVEGASLIALGLAARKARPVQVLDRPTGEAA